MSLTQYEEQCLVMYTSYVSNQLFEVDWRKLQTTLDGQNVKYTAIDGADAALKEVRNALWEVSEKRTYPQVFVFSDGQWAYMGGMEEVQESIDMGSFTTNFARFTN